MTLQDAFLITELVALWLTIIISVTEYKWSREDRAEKKAKDVK